MVGRSLWSNHHYWSRVVRIVKGVKAVWEHDERKHGGYAQLISQNLSDIGGQFRNTTAVFYTRDYLPDEVEIIQQAETKLNDLELGSKGDIPFTFLDQLSHNEIVITNNLKEQDAISINKPSISQLKESSTQCTREWFINIFSVDIYLIIMLYS